MARGCECCKGGSDDGSANDRGDVGQKRRFDTIDQHAPEALQLLALPAQRNRLATIVSKVAERLVPYLYPLT